MLDFGGKTGLRTCARPDFIGFNGKFKHSCNNNKIKTKNYKPEIKSKIRPRRESTAGPLYHMELDLSSIIFSLNCTKKPRRPIRGFLSVLFYWLAVDGQSSAYSYRRRLRYSSPWMGLVKPTPQMLYDTPGTVGGT